MKRLVVTQLLYVYVIYRLDTVIIRDNDYSLKIRCGVSIDFNFPANSPLLTGSDQVWKMRAEQYTVK